MTIPQGWEFALSLKIAHFKERPWDIRSLKKIDVSDLLVIPANHLQKTSDSMKNSYFCMF